MTFETITGDANLLERELRNGTADRFYQLVAPVYEVDRPITIPAGIGRRMSGYGTRLIWVGQDPERRLSMLNFEDNRRPVIEGFDIEVHAPLGAAIRFAQTHRGDQGQTISTNPRIRDVTIQGGGDLGVGVWWDCLGEKDRPNNEHAVLDDVRVSSARVGFQIDGSQSKYHTFRNCHVEGDTLRGPGSPHTECAVRSSGSFTWDGGSAYGCAVAAFHLTDQTDTVQIRDADVESSLRFLVTESPQGRTGTLQPVRIDGGRFMCDALHEDGGAILLRHPGPLSVANFQIGSGRQAVGLILAESLGHARIALDGVVWGSWIQPGDPLELIQAKWGSVQVTSQGCYFHDSTGERVPLPVSGYSL